GVREEGAFAADRRVGHWRYFHGNGQKALEGDYKEGLRDGHFQKWAESGLLVEDGAYENDRKSGEWTELRSGFGGISAKYGKQQGSYREGKKTGVWRLTDPDGRLYGEEEYRDDQLDGRYLRYWPNGRKCAEITYKAGQPGRERRWKRNGQPGRDP